MRSQVWFALGSLLLIGTLLLSMTVSPSQTQAVTEPHLGYGVNIAERTNMNLVQDMGFDWVKSFAWWADIEPKEGRGYNWANVDNVINAAHQHGLKLLLRVERPPAWAREAGTTETGPVRPDQLDAFAAFLDKLVEHARYKVVAYEIWNEPNLDAEWGGRSPDPERYVEILKTAYEAIKKRNPQAIVVSAGLSTAGEGGPGAMGDLIYLQGMYNAGAKGYFDVLGSHPYGGPYDPDKTTGARGGMCFYRAKEQHDVMVEYGDGDKKVWATEFGWVLGTDCDLGRDHEWMEVSEEKQATYLVRAYRKAHFEWPWMGVMFLFNLDFATVSWYEDCDPKRWYSITYRHDPLDPGHSPIQYRQAYFALKAMPKPPLPLVPKAYLPAVFKSHLSPLTCWLAGHQHRPLALLDYLFPLIDDFHVEDHYPPAQLGHLLLLGDFAVDGDGVADQDGLPELPGQT